MGARIVVGAAVVFMVGGCAPGSRDSPSSPGPSTSCLVFTGSESGSDPGDPGFSPPNGRSPSADFEREGRPSPLVVGLTRSVDPAHAPLPTNPDEAFVFGMLYEPLVRMDCTGRLYPGLASSWEADDQGRRWTFTLRSGARFWDGDPVTAREVAESWRRVEESGRSPWTPAPPLSVEVLDPGRLRVTFAEASSRPPTVLSSPGLALARPAPTEPWPSVGTGPYRVSGGSRPSSGDPVEDIVLEPASRDPDAPPFPPLHLRVDPDADPRDLLGGGVDVLLTADAETLEYARLRSNLVSRPLPWSRRYVLALRPTGVEAGGADSARVLDGAGTDADPTGVGLPSSFLHELAQDVVREEARPPASIGCELGGPLSTGTGLSPSPSVPAAGGRPRIGYDGNDPTARALAERLVALATAPGSRRDPETGTTLRILGLDDAPPGLVAAAVESTVPGADGVEDPADPGRAGTLNRGEMARVLAIPRRPDAACRDDGAANPSREGSLLIPLVETRERLISRTEGIRVAVDGTGTPFLLGGDR